MKRFFRKIFIIALGTIVGGVVVLIGSLGALWSFQKYKSHTAVSATIKPKSILRIDLHGQLIEDRPQPLLSRLTSSNTPRILDILKIKKAVLEAKKDSHIEGIYIEVGELLTGWSSLTELRSILQDFKNSGKFIIAYGENYTAKTYYLTSLADEIVLHPAGNFIFMGLQLTVLFYKDLLDKLEITPQIFRVGKYKSAVEPFIQRSMSVASKQQNSILLQDIYEEIIEALATARNISAASLKKMANDLSVTQPQQAYAAKLFTQLGYFNEVEIWLKSKLVMEVGAKINYVDFDAYEGNIQSKRKSTEKIAVLVTSGTIVDQEIGANQIATKAFVKTLRELREDDNIKAIVLRINSPGGSALASDTMWKEIQLTKACKPIVASMLDVAASGGYYLAMGCNYIFSYPTTITGSIGVFGLYFDVHKLLNHKLGIFGDVVKTSTSADIFNVTRPMTPPEKNVIQQHVQATYTNFLNKVSEGRQMKLQDVITLAEGRVFSGVTAQKYGLVDELGMLEDAIKKAAALASLKEDTYQIEYWPKSKENWIKQLIIDIVDNKNYQLWQNSIPNSYYTTFQDIQAVTNRQGVQAWLPYTVEIN